MKYLTTIGEKTYTIEINDDQQGSWMASPYPVDLEAVGGQPLYSLLINNQSFASVGRSR